MGTWECHPSWWALACMKHLHTWWGGTKLPSPHAGAAETLAGMWKPSGGWSQSLAWGALGAHSQQGTTLSLIGLQKQFSQIKVPFPQWWGLMSKLSVASVLGYISYQVAGNLKFAGDWNQSFLKCALSNLGSVWFKAVEKMNEVFHTRTCSGSGLFWKKFQVSLIL